MSPLVAKLDLALDNALLQSITLVDLPGVGVIGDPAGRVAEEFVRTQADALVIVARNNGLTEAIGGVLERTGVVTKLLFGGNEDIPAISIIIAITQLDEVTKDHYSREAAAAQESDDPLPDRHAIFERLAAQMSDKVKQQIFDALQASPAFDELPEPQRLRRESIINDLCRRMQVLCVSAPDYNYLLLNQEELAFLKRRETTHIPAFQGALRQLSEAAAVARQARIAAAQSSLQALILQFTEQLEIDDRARPTPESGWEIFRTKLEEKASSLKDQANTNRLSVGKFLREDMPQRLDTLSKEAASHADKRLASLKRKGEQLHYQSLNAALTRDGKFEDRNIDYPEALTRSLVDTIAGAWEPTVVEEVRQAVQRLATQDMALVRELYDHAKLLDAGAVDPQRLEVLQKTLDQQAKTTIEWTGDQLEKLRTDVHDQLHSVALKPIEKACRRAVDSAENRGLGAKTRILDAFHNGGLRAIEGAREKALEVLGLHFQKLQSQLTRSVLRRNYDPVRIAFDSLVSEDVASAHRGGNEEHARRTAQIQQLVHEVAQITAALTAPSPSALPHAAREEPPVLQPGSNARSAGNDMFADLGRRS